MKHNYIARAVFFLSIILFNTVYGQQHTKNTITIDSVIFANTRAQLNNISTDSFEKRVFHDGSHDIPYRLLLPQDYSTSEKYPLVITFHNSSRIGDDNENQLEHLARTWLRANMREEYRCFVVAPHFNARSSMYTKNKEDILVSNPSQDAMNILQLIDSLQGEYPSIDPKRIYLIGYSMGASTALNLLSLAPERFGALVSIAAVPDLSNIERLKSKNIWLIHGEKDTDNPYAGSQVLFKKLKHNKALRFSTFRELDHHNIVIPFLLNDQIASWLFGQSL